MSQFYTYFREDFALAENNAQFASPQGLLLTSVRALEDAGLVTTEQVTAADSGEPDTLIVAVPSHAERLLMILSPFSATSAESNTPLSFRSFNSLKLPVESAQIDSVVAVHSNMFFLWQLSLVKPVEPPPVDRITFPVTRDFPPALTPSRLFEPGSLSYTLESAGLRKEKVGTIQRDDIMTRLRSLCKEYTEKTRYRLRLLLQSPSQQCNELLSFAVARAFPRDGPQYTALRSALAEALLETASLPQASDSHGVVLTGQGWCTPKVMGVVETLKSLGLVLYDAVNAAAAGLEPSRGRVIVLRPTPLTAAIVTSGSDDLVAGGLSLAEAKERANAIPLPATHGAATTILVENNFKAYMYSTRPDMQAAFQIIAQTHARTPALLIGELTDYSYLRAHTNGIEAPDIIAFLSRHAHPARSLTREVLDLERTAAGQICALPVNVTDQLQLWQSIYDCLSVRPARQLRHISSAQMRRLFDAAQKDMPAADDDDDNEYNHPWLLWPIPALATWINSKATNLTTIIIVDDDTIQQKVLEIAMGMRTSISDH